MCMDPSSDEEDDRVLGKETSLGNEVEQDFREESVLLLWQLWSS